MSANRCHDTCTNRFTKYILDLAYNPSIYIRLPRLKTDWVSEVFIICINFIRRTYECLCANTAVVGNAKRLHNTTTKAFEL